MKVEYNEETSVRKSLSFEIEPELVEREIESRAREYARKVKLPGFRAGKIPPTVIRRRFRQEVLGDVVEKLVNKVVFEELEGRGLKPVATPKVEDLKAEEGQPLTFRAVFETLPIMELPDFRGLEVRARRGAVSEAEVEAEIERQRENAARYEPVEGRPTGKGDHVVVDLAWRPLDGGKGGRNEDAFLEVGAEGNHPDLNATLLGLSVGDNREVEVAYPAESHEHEPGHEHDHEPGPPRRVHYTLTLKAVKSKVLPALDDEFAKDLEHGSLAELRAAVRSRLLEADERRADRELKAALVARLVEKASFDVPESLVERHMNARTEQAARLVALQGVDPAKANVDWAGFREGQRAEAEKAARGEILLDEIARREGLEVTERELEGEVTAIAARLHRPREVVRARMEKDGDLHALRARIREDKVLDLIKANATMKFE